MQRRHWTAFIVSACLVTACMDGPTDATPSEPPAAEGTPPSGREQALEHGPDWTLETDTKLTSLALDRALSFLVYGAAGRERALYASWDLGDHWLRGPVLGDARDPTPDPLPADVVQDPDGGGSAYASSFSTLYRTQSAGLAWRVIGAAPKLLAVTPGGDVLWGTDAGTLQKSIDRGRTWTAIAFPGESCCSEVVASSVQDVYVRTERGLLRSLDGGATWTPRTPPDLRNLATVAVDARDPRVVYTVSEDIAPFGGLRKSIDGGATWFPPSPAFAAEPVNWVAVSPVDGRVYLSAVERDAAGENRARHVHVSQDGAATFVLAERGLEGDYLSRIFVHPSRRCVAFVIATRGLYRTLNAGGTCAPTTPPAAPTRPPPG